MSFLNQIYLFIKTNPLISVFFTFSLSLLVWIYKESKGIIQTDSKANMDNLVKKLQVYGGLESVVALYLKDKSKDIEIKLHESLGNSTPYLSDRIRHIIADYYKDLDVGRITIVRTLLEVEIEALRKDFLEIQMENKTQDFDNFIIKLLRPAKPIVYLVLILFVLFVSIIEWSQTETWLEKTGILLGGCSFLFGVANFSWFITALLEKKLKYRTKEFISLQLTLSLSPVFSLFYLELALLVVIIQIISIYLIIRFISKNKLITIL